MAGETIVIIDDEANIVELFSMYLQLQGYVPRGALTGEDGLTLIQLERPSAVLLDLMLPDIQGDEVLRRLRADPVSAKLPVLIISAQADDRAYGPLLALGANGYLKKPVAMAQLTAELTRILAGGTWGG